MDKDRLGLVDNDERVLAQEWRRGLVGLNLLKQNAMDRHWPVFSSITNHVDEAGEVHHWLIISWLSRDTDLPRIELLDQNGNVVKVLPDAPKVYWSDYYPDDLERRFKDTYTRGIAVWLCPKGKMADGHSPAVAIDLPVDDIGGILMRSDKNTTYIPVIRPDDMTIEEKKDDGDKSGIPFPF